MEQNKLSKEQLEQIKSVLDRRCQTMYEIVMDYQMQIKHIEDLLKTAPSVPGSAPTATVKEKPAESKKS